MSLENPNFLEDLNEGWPVGAVDQLHEGDDHIRGTKKAILNTFPGLVGRAFRTISRPASVALGVNDNMTLNNCAAITLTPDAASVLGNGWMCLVRASSGAVTINPGNNINGAGEVIVPSGYTSILFCNGSEFFSMIVYQDVPVAAKAFPTGTRTVFQQTAAPTGWTKDASAAYNDAAFRATNGTAGVGGSLAFSTTFAAGQRTGAHALTIAQMPAHNHGNAVKSQASGEGGQIPPNSQWANAATDSAGGGATHDHSVPSLAIKYVDLIVASIN